MSEALRKAFLIDQFHAMVLQATVQRAAIYEPSAPEESREQFRGGLRKALARAALGYADVTTEEAHLDAIVTLSGEITEAHAAALRGGRFRIGPAQKSLNLFLKYLWCSGEIPMPPHCPFDAVVIARLPSSMYVPWTRIDSIEAYVRLVAAARVAAGDRSLADWELHLYQVAYAGASRAV